MKLFSLFFLGLFGMACLCASVKAEEDSLQDLAKGLQHAKKEERRKAAYALHALGKRAAPVVGALTQALGDEDDQVWHEATMALAAIGPDAAVAIPGLIEQMGGGGSRYREQRRHRSAFALSRIGSAAVPALEKALDDDNPHRRWGALHGFGLLGEAEPAIQAKLVSLLADEEEMVRLEAEEACLALGEAVLPQVAECLQHTDAVARKHAAEVIRRFSGSAVEAYRNVIVKRFSEESDPGARGALLSAAAVAGVDREFLSPFLMDALLSESDELRDRAFDVLVTREAIAAETVPTISLLLTDRSLERREVAAKLLGRLGEGALPAVHLLIRQLEDAARGPEEVGWYREALVLIGPSVIPLVVEALRSLSPEALSADHWAVSTLRGLAPLALPRLEEALGDETPSVACGVMLALPRYTRRNPAVEKRVLRYLDHDDAVLRALAASSLVRLKLPEDAWRRAILRAAEDSSPEVRVAVLQTLSLAPLSNERRLELVLQGMESERPAVRLASVQQLGALGATAASATPVLLASLKESEGSSLEYQRAAIEAVGKVGEGAVEALPYLRDVLAQASDNDLRVAALTSLGAMGASARQALPAIEGLMEDEDEALRQASLSAYGRIESNAEKLVPVYLSALKDRSFTVRQPVIEGLGRLGERAEAAAPSLVELLDSEKDRTVALEALREIRPRSLELCLRMLAHESPGVRLFACDRLGRLRDREAIPALRQALRDDYSFVRRRAREALERIESPREQR